MNIPKPIKTVANFFSRQNNAVGDNLGKQFFKYGNKRPLVQDWSKVVMTDQDSYTGYSFAAIKNRANKTAQMATENIKTYTKPQLQQRAKDKGEVIEHPYLSIIDKSQTFSNHQFWSEISTYLDLEGVYYLLVVRTVQGERVGRPMEFKLLNPYNVRRIRNKDTGEIGGYVEARDGMVRNIPKEMIIELRNLNPFSVDDPFSLTDAANEFQFTLKQAGDYTRHSLKNNMASPGILTTDMLLDDEQFQNFVSRVTNQEKGLPIFGNGSGAITWDAMQIQLDKAGLKDINEINRAVLFAVSGVGKTMMSIEESGTTRETALVQKDLFTEAHIIPQLQLIIDALNQDYKRYYANDYESNKYRLYIDNPLKTDREAELKDIEIREKSFDIYNSLVNKGYLPELAAKYTEGELTLEELGQPTEETKQISEPKQSPQQEQSLTKPSQTNKEYAPSSDSSHTNNHAHSEVTDRVTNEFDEETTGLIAIQQSSLQNDVERIEATVVGAVLSKITKSKNAFEEQSDIIYKTDEERLERELQRSLEVFYLAMFPIFASSLMAKRTKEFGMTASYKTTPEVRKSARELSKLVSESHMNTILEDLRLAIKGAYDEAVSAALSNIESSGRKPTDADLKLARKLALEGKGQAQIISAVRQKYTDFSNGRAKTIARTEASRAFNQSQYEADLQFMKQNNLEGRVYKKWITRSDNPCQFCIIMSKEPLKPLDEPFLDLGDKVEYEEMKNGKLKVRKMFIDFEPITAGLLHPNCGCTYKLVLE